MQSARIVALLVLALAIAAAQAQAATVRVAQTGGCARTMHTPSHDGLLTVRLAAGDGDWDLRLFDGSRRLGASASFGAREVVTARVRAGRTVSAQACRRTGTSPRATVRFADHPVEPTAGPAEPVQLLRVTLLSERDHARLEATGIDVTHNRGDGYVDVVSYGAADRAKLRAVGLPWQVRTADLADATRQALQAPPAGRAAVALPSGRTAYRTLADYEADLKALADANPALVKPLELGRSIEDRAIQGLEIAKDVARTDDGRPVLAVLGLHHAREWPSGEMPMELAVDLVENAAEPRVAALLERVRVIVVPVVNPDGFEVSRSAPSDASSGETFAYKRKNCRPIAGAEDTPCALRLQQGVDLNRNYGAYWGGTGSSSTASAQNYRGPAPFSEPESEAIHRLSQTRNIINVVSHHTFTDEGVWLRQPGFCLVKPEGRCSDTADVVPDEAGMKALGDAMGAATGWESLLGWKIGEITGATEDWNYFAASAYGYTPEQRGPNFHAAHADMVVAEWPGVREALLRAGELAADPAFHSVISGTAPAGHRLRLRKAFTTATSMPDVVVDDTLDIVTTVPASGDFTWHVNPSTRPLAPAAEVYSVICETPAGEVLEETMLIVERGEVTPLVNGCGEAETPNETPEEAAPEPSPTPASPSPSPAADPAAATPVPIPPIVDRIFGALPRMSIARLSASARRFNRRRRLGIALRVDRGPVLGVVARLTGRGGLTFARARVARLDGDTRLAMRALKGRRLRSGRHTVVVRARDADGRTVTARRSVRIR